MPLIEQLLGLVIQTVSLFVQLLISIFTFFIVALTAVLRFLGL
jgi:hypothetical protein